MAIAQELGVAPTSELGKAVAKLERAVNAFEAGDVLLRGELLDGLAAGLRRRLGG